VNINSILAVIYLTKIQNLINLEYDINLSEYDEVDEEVIYLTHRSLQIWWKFTEILTGSWIDLLSTDSQLKNHFSF
jgi:hypothetical protein